MPNQLLLDRQMNFPLHLKEFAKPINVVLPSEPPLLKMIERIGNAE